MIDCICSLLYIKCDCVSLKMITTRCPPRPGHTKYPRKMVQIDFQLGTHALRLEFNSAARNSVWNCIWTHALKRSPWINHKSRVLYPGPGFLSSDTWPSMPKKHYNGLIILVALHYNLIFSDFSPADKSSRAIKSRPSVFSTHQKRPAYSDKGDDDRRKRAEMNNRSYMQLLDRYRQKNCGSQKSVTHENVSPSPNGTQLQKRSHTTMLPARSEMLHHKKGAGHVKDSSLELFDLFVRVNTISDINMQQNDGATSVPPNIECLHPVTNSHSNQRCAVNMNRAASSMETVNTITCSETHNEPSGGYLNADKQGIAKSTRCMKNRQIFKQNNPDTISKKTKKKNDLKETFNLDFLDKDMRKKLFYQFEKGRNSDGNANGGSKSKVTVSMPEIIRDANRSRRPSVQIKATRSNNVQSLINVSEASKTKRLPDIKAA